MEKNSFENFIMHCCQLPEWELRDYLKKELSAIGFVFMEDDYASYRGGKYLAVKNLLFKRGENPKVCLVAHTDVCRDHGRGMGYHGRDSDPPKVDPIIRSLDHEGFSVKVIQDRSCRTQVGGDDRLGVAINVWLAMNTGYDMGLLFTTDEEVGLDSAQYASFDSFNNFELFCQVDRGNNSDQLVLEISGMPLIHPSIAMHLLNIAAEMGMPRTPVRGLITDVAAIKENYPNINAVNMTCGYHNSYGDSAKEYIIIEEARDTMKYVAQIIKDYDLRDEPVPQIDFTDEEEEIPESAERYLLESAGASQEEAIAHIESDWE